MKTIDIRDMKYQIVEGAEFVDLDELPEKITDYFDDFDYIFGDYIDNKVRLKGFCDKNNKRCNKINNIEGLEKYRNTMCTPGAKVILLKKIK